MARSNDQIAHLWAEYNLTDNTRAPREARGSHFYYDGDTVYSYGRHFPIARVVQHSKTQRAVLFTTRSYSVTTSQHCGHVRSALKGRDVPVFHVPDVLKPPTSADNHTDYQHRVDEAFKSAALAREHADWKLKRAIKLVQEANEFARFFGMRWRIQAPKDLTKLKDHIRETAAKDAARTKARAAQARKYFEKALACWIHHLPIPVRPAGIERVNIGDMPTRLRIHENGEEVETSLGARVPLDHAKRLWPVIQRVRESGIAYKRNGHTEHVGHFAIDSIDVDGTVKAGCHTIKADEIDRFAKVLGVA